MNVIPKSGDLVLVDTSCYGVSGYNWCKVTRLASGSAAIYPIKVEVPDRGEGQYAISEIHGYQNGQEVP